MVIRFVFLTSLQCTLLHYTAKHNYHTRFGSISEIDVVVDLLLSKFFFYSIWIIRYKQLLINIRKGAKKFLTCQPIITLDPPCVILQTSIWLSGPTRVGILPLYILHLLSLVQILYQKQRHGIYNFPLTI